MRSIISVLAASLLLAAGTGCGGDEEESGGGTTTAAAATTDAATTEADDYARPEPAADQSRWAKQVEAACAPVQRQIDALPQPTDAASLETWVGRVLPLVRKETAAVKAVKPPTKDEEARRAGLFIESLEKLDDALTRYLAALREGDTGAIEAALTDANAAGAEARAYAVSLDVTGCGGYSDS